MGALLVVSDTIPPADREEALSFFESLFGNGNPLVVELCSGNGHFLVENAVKNPATNFIGTEILSGRSRKFHAKIEKRSLANVVLFRGEVRRFVWEFLYEEMVDEFITLFPDPWPKKRHHKHRLFTAAFIKMLHARLVPRGTVSIATDSTEYREWILDVFGSFGGFTNQFDGGFSHYPADYPESMFLKRFRRDGREVNYMRFRKEG